VEKTAAGQEKITMENIFLYLLYFVLFSVLTAVIGLLASWVDRKVTARVQYRVGPPWYQGFADFLKLMGKETVVPEGARFTGFLISPLIGLAGIALVSVIVWVVNLRLASSFVGDLIVVLYLLVLPSLAVILGASASRNPLAGVGASREMKLMLGYELPFVLAMIVPILRSGGMLKLNDLLVYQQNNGSFLSGGIAGISISGAIAFITAIICMQAKLTLVPFDIPEAETEIMAGVYIEYSGPALAVFKLTKAMMLFTVPAFLITVFWGGMNFSSPINWIQSILKYIVLLVIIILIRNTNPRLRIDQAMKFFWGKLSFLAIAALILAVFGF